jgi:hypothetical protein
MPMPAGRDAPAAKTPSANGRAKTRIGGRLAACNVQVTTLSRVQQRPSPPSLARRKRSVARGRLVFNAQWSLDLAFSLLLSRLFSFYNGLNHENAFYKAVA